MSEVPVLSEGTWSERHRRITVEPGKCGGRACIRGLRLRVLDILNMLSSGMTPEQILHDFDILEAADISAALAFAADVLEDPQNLP
ncbi:MAG: DUF433 domain-containing protein [Tepidiformaceae bacterium]